MNIFTLNLKKKLFNCLLYSFGTQLPDNVNFPLNLESYNQAKNTFFSTELPSQYLRQIGQGVRELCSDIQTNRDY